MFDPILSAYNYKSGVVILIGEYIDKDISSCLHQGNGKLEDSFDSLAFTDRGEFWKEY